MSRKNFKSLVNEAVVMQIEPGNFYAQEDVTPADERLSILLTGR